MSDDPKLIHKILGGPTHYSQIVAGFSPDRKYKVEPDLLLRVCPGGLAEERTAEFEAVGKLRRAGVKCAEAIRFGVEDDICYCLYSYIDGAGAERAVPGLSEAEQFEFGLDSGRQLALIHDSLGPGNPVDERAVREAKFDRYTARLQELGMTFEGRELSERFVRSHLHLLDGRPSTFRHGDFHLGNLIADGPKLAGVIDFNRCDWGDPIDDFYKTAFFSAPSSAPFARGLVKGYFEGEPPAEFWPLYNIYVAATLPGDLVWAEKLFPEELPGAFQRVERITATHDFKTGGPPNWWGNRA